MHHIYHTEGIILGSKNYGETGKYYFVFTRDLGMIVASAQGVRKMSSKLRFVLQDFSYLKIDFVRGKDFWKITSAQKTNQLEEIKSDKEKMVAFAKLSGLLRRLLAGEDPNEELFQDFLAGLLFLEKSKSKERCDNIEAVIVLRCLNNLGYIGDNNTFNKMIRFPFEEDLIFEVAGKRSQILFEINKALGETQL